MRIGVIINSDLITGGLSPFKMQRTLRDQVHGAMKAAVAQMIEEHRRRNLPAVIWDKVKMRIDPSSQLRKYKTVAQDRN